MGWSGRHPVWDRPRRSGVGQAPATGVRQECTPAPAGHVPEEKVFEPLGESASERSTGNRKMMVIVWVVVGVATLAMIALSLM